MNRIVLDRSALGNAIPQRDRTFRLWLKHDLADGLANQRRDAAPRPRRGLVERGELVFSKVNLRLDHVCQTIL